MLLLYKNKDKEKNEMTEEEKDNKNGIAFWIGLMFGGWMGLISGAISTQNTYKDFIPERTKIEYINSDNLPDLVYKTGEIYLQTKQGNFVSYNEILQKEKAKLDSIYQIKQDSLKRVFENKLEKEVK